MDLKLWQDSGIRVGVNLKRHRFEPPNPHRFHDGHWDCSYPTLQDGNNERQDETTDREFVFTTDLPEYCVELGHLCDA